MVNKTIKVIKEKKNKNTTDAHLQVKSYGGYEMQDWNGQEVVEALTKECGLKITDATKIAEDVYKDIIKIGKHEIEVATLKNMINYHLLMNGHNGVKLQGQMNVGMSVYDLDNLIKNKSSENSNVGNNNPEAVALCITENSLKKYALNKVFSKDVSEAHLMGKIHAHDLGQITKSYAFSLSTKVELICGNETVIKTLQEIYNENKDCEEQINETQFEVIIHGYKIKDRGNIVDIERLVISKEKKKMFKFTTSCGEICVTKEHGCIVKRDNKYIIIRADEVLFDDKFVKVI